MANLIFALILAITASVTLAQDDIDIRAQDDDIDIRGQDDDIDIRGQDDDIDIRGQDDDIDIRGQDDDIDIRGQDDDIDIRGQDDDIDIRALPLSASSASQCSYSYGRPDSSLQHIDQKSVLTKGTNSVTVTMPKFGPDKTVSFVCVDIANFDAANTNVLFSITNDSLVTVLVALHEVAKEDIQVKVRAMLDKKAKLTLN